MPEEIKKEQFETQAQGVQEEPAEKTFNLSRVEIPEVEGFVFPDKGTVLENGSFSSESNGQNVPENLKIFMRPLVIGEPGKDISYESSEAVLDVKSTYAMGKAACIEHPVNIDGQDYNFIQWKGVGANKVTETIPQREGVDWHFPFGKEGIAPLFTVEAGKWTLARFMGTAYYDDLLREKQQYENIVAKTEIRTPKILGTFKFTREFCQQNNLPIPENNEPNSDAGQGLREYIENRMKGMDKGSDEYLHLQELLLRTDLDFESSAICGENVRVFRNPWRVMEIEEAMKETDEVKRSEKLSAIFETSKKVFGKEFGHEISNDEFIEKFSSLLGQQTALLLKNKIVQGAMKEHKQDVTLAAEICDWDTSYQLNDDFFNNPENQPKWIDSEKDKQEWVGQEHLILFRQILLVASNLKPVLEAGQQMGSELSQNSIVKEFTEGLVGNLSKEQRKILSEFLSGAKDFQDIESIAGGNKERGSKPNGRILDNLKGYQEYFDTLTGALKSGLKKQRAKNKIS